MPSSTFIRLSGPIQSWAGQSVSGNYIRTSPIPTLSGLRGLLAGAIGAHRNEVPEWIKNVRFSVREDRTGTFVDDFQTIGSREEEWDFRRRIAILQGMTARSIKQLSFIPATKDQDTAIVRRTYLSEAEFIVRVTDERHTEEIDHAFSAPVFATYLGRKAFPAAFPFYLGTGNEELFRQIPIVKQASKSSEDTTPTAVGIVRIYELDPPLPPQTTQVPAVRSREEWLENISGLGLHRRSTVLSNA